MNTVLITGGNRGIGLGLVKAFAALNQGPELILTTCRKTTNSKELLDLAHENKNIKVLQFDVANFSAYNIFSEKVSSIVQDRGLNTLINNAGVSDKFSRINLVKLEKLQECFTINSIAPIMLTKALLPLLKQAAEKNNNASMSGKKASIINISSVLGSISENKEGGLYAYKCSKSALNAATKCLSIDLKQNEILAVSLHPGWVKTTMGGQKAPLTVDEVSPLIIQTIMSLGVEHNGGFFDYQGKQIPW